LPNRRLLIERLREAVNFFEKSRESFALCFLDIDDFKKINDQYGHIVGDDILVQLATRLQHQLKPTDTLARQGGDEFVIVIYNVDSSSQILEKIDELKRVVQEPLTSHDETFVISASFGYSIYMIDSNTIEDLLKVADRRMYREKFRTLEQAK
jgi:diguanylate cyclase (GGDEF)-like protein